ncbi:MAG: hypothetical protein LIP09_15000 [Bacteroidales bacterium]|nr:hypothetical protein [Bacteroidales bacterium]
MKNIKFFIAIITPILFIMGDQTPLISQNYSDVVAYEYDDNYDMLLFLNDGMTIEQAPALLIDYRKETLRSFDTHESFNKR